MRHDVCHKYELIFDMFLCDFNKTVRGKICRQHLRSTTVNATVKMNIHGSRPGIDAKSLKMRHSRARDDGRA